MASAPSERPELFVCDDCQNVVAGVPTHSEAEEHPYDEWTAPEECPACGGESLVQFDEYPTQF